MNSQDHADGGFSEEEASKLIQMLEVARADFIEISGGTYEKFVFFEDQKESTKRREAFFLEFSARVKPHIKKSLIVVTGGFRQYVFNTGIDWYINFVSVFQVWLRQSVTGSVILLA